MKSGESTAPIGETADHPTLDASASDVVYFTRNWAMIPRQAGQAFHARLDIGHRRFRDEHEQAASDIRRFRSFRALLRLLSGCRWARRVHGFLRD